jgi:transposase-like protein
MERRKFTREFKLEAVRLSTDAGLRERYGQTARRVALERWDRTAIIAALESRLEILTARPALQLA